ncbi:GGDEF domain-containing protein [Motiliproteus coralliicola]|uniref:diguanylate cyclase n=1 Tax=Motiliproteus coralliicola TaxID=2283196 RepID=A0A369WSL5_9GAMM|nr:GGDEF domain-containing protein [Motiliproteus coralliicola]RDE25090.1 GGDEF domain-containing protein [Motiliproteus coralliicola]
MKSDSDEIWGNKPLLLSWLLCIIYGTYVAVTNEPIEGSLDWFSVCMEGTLTLLPASVLYAIQGLKKQSQVYLPLFVGLTLIILALITDTLDELVHMPTALNALVEGVFQVIGYLLLLIGLKRWVDIDNEQKKHLLKLATTDSLTGIFNRRHFIDALNKETYRCRRYNEALSVILFDIDFFKKINDQHGHNVGDTVLIEVTQRVRHAIRDSDLLARYGGEEFMLLVPEANVETATRMAEKIRQQLQQNQMQGVGQITASFGVSQYRICESPHDLLTRVDQALYRAKSAGRNTVVSL